MPASPPTLPLAAPLAFEPYIRPQVWGDQRLRTLLNKPLPDAARYGESWELCPLPQALSRVADGPHAGMTLDELWQLGLRDRAGLNRGGFPWLVKWLDVDDWLSVQVHPDEAHAQKWLDEPCAKSEAWVVIHAEPTARVYAGFHAGVTERDVRRAMEHGQLVDCLHSFVPQVGDCINIPAGTVHAGGGGLVIAEVQQPSDATFRMFDWNRVSATGQPRALHIQESLDCISWPQGPVCPESPTPWETEVVGVTAERLLATKHFEWDRFQLAATWDDAAERMAVWMVLDGSATATWSGGERHLSRGDTVLLPAGVPALAWQPVTEVTTLLRVRLPGE
jgi:mannose-6-phosphate isomerase